MVYLEHKGKRGAGIEVSKLTVHKIMVDKYLTTLIANIKRSERMRRPEKGPHGAEDEMERIKSVLGLPVHLSNDCGVEHSTSAGPEISELTVCKRMVDKYLF